MSATHIVSLVNDIFSQYTAASLEMYECCLEPFWDPLVPF